jgi:pimeloyl-ACP methyl ester carboxylesterase
MYPVGDLLTALTQEQVHEESLWFGSADRPLFGRLTTPAGETALGGVLLSPPIGRESRQARRAMRSLALRLANEGYVTLRYDHFGTGDSSGTMDDDEFDETWIEGVDHGVALLRSFGVTSVSAVGMRMGATIVGTAAAAYDLGLTSFVMWDPCESGRKYARELNALGALRRKVITDDKGEPTRMLEYPLSEGAVGRLNRFSLIEPSTRSPADRVLIVARDDRPVSSKFRARWEQEGVEWLSNSDQGPMLETELPTMVEPTSTIIQIQSWLTAAKSQPVALSRPPSSREAIVMKGSNAFPVRESIVELGSQKLFGIVSEPSDGAHGPLIVLVNGIMEDHVGPARLWVELSRRWAGLGLRCVRFDVSDCGESPRLVGAADSSALIDTRPQDVGDAVRALNPESPTDSVLIGYCNGAQLSLEVALELKTRGVCAINPQLGTGVFLHVDRLEESDRESIRSFPQRVESLFSNHQWVDKMIRTPWRAVLASKSGGNLVFGFLRLASVCPPKVRSAFAKNGTETLLLLSPEDLSSLLRVPVIGALLRRRQASTENFHVEIVPELDHAFLSVLGRSRAVALLDQHIVETFANADPVNF